MKHGHGGYAGGCRCGTCRTARNTWKRAWSKRTGAEVREGKRRVSKERYDAGTYRVCRGPRPSNPPAPF